MYPGEGGFLSRCCKLKPLTLGWHRYDTQPQWSKRKLTNYHQKHSTNPHHPKDSRHKDLKSVSMAKCVGKPPGCGGLFIKFAEHMLVGGSCSWMGALGEGGGRHENKSKISIVSHCGFLINISVGSPFPVDLNRRWSPVRLCL